TVTVKATKFMVGSFIPVVGGAISDALNSVQGCLGLMKSSIGAFGILACVFTFLPAILTVLFYMLVLKISSAAGSLFGLSGVTEIFDAVYDALSILMAFLICYSLLTIVTTTLMISMSSGG
ncbi:MAG: stage III sporulation protein AE, partial [Massilioclostridium sp.]|nr:stage III sporulation protein AE [Massilioclostridium sp.]